MMTEKSEKEVILEDYHEYPAGRGKKAFFGTSSTVEPKKRQKRNPKRYCLFRIKANPQHIEIVIYKPRLSNYVIYPNKRRITQEEIIKLIASLLTCYLYTYRGQNTMKIPLFWGTKNRITLPKPLRNEIVQQTERFYKWIRKNQK